MLATARLRPKVLDQSLLRPGATARQAVLATVALAQPTDRFGHSLFRVSGPGSVGMKEEGV